MGIGLVSLSLPPPPPPPPPPDEAPRAPPSVPRAPSTPRLIITDPDAAAAPPRAPPPVPRGPTTYSVVVPRTARGLGLTVDDENRICEIDSSGGAGSCPELRVGDIIVKLDGATLHGPLRETIDPSASSYELTLGRLDKRSRRPPEPPHAPSAPQPQQCNPSGVDATPPPPAAIKRSGSAGAPSSSKPVAGKAAGGEGVRLTLMVTRNFGPLGVSLNDSNVVTHVRPGSAAVGVLEVGDRVLGVDGVQLGKRKLMQVIKPQPCHAFSVLRVNVADRSATVIPSGPGNMGGISDRNTDRSAEKGGFFGFGKSKKNSILMSNDQANGWGF